MMQSRNILEKISLIREYALNPDNSYISCDFDLEKKNHEKDIEEYRKKLSFSSELYLDFLRKFGAPRISWIYILPLNDDNIPDINKSLERLKEYWDYSEGYLPFAEDGGSYIYCFDQGGKVWGFSSQGYFEKPDFFANSFEEFIDECLLGKRYEEFISTDDNPFYDFLKKQGWV